MVKKSEQKRTHIRSESHFAFDLLREILFLPVTFILVLLKKKKASELKRPLKVIKTFLSETRFTIAIININILVFIISIFFPENILMLLANSPQNMFTGKFYSLITSGFLHANVYHLFGNLLFIFIFGRVLERKIGAKKTTLIYFGAMIISAVFSNIINYFILGISIPGIGASGALMGLVATAMLLDPLYMTFAYILPLPIMVVGWLAIYSDIIGILNPMQSNIGHFAHLGGFLSIAILVYLFSDEDKKKMKKGVYINLISIVIAALIIFLS